MARNNVCKTQRGKVSEETMLLAVMQVIQHKRSVREVSKEFNIPRKTLGRYCIAKRKKPWNRNRRQQKKKKKKGLKNKKLFSIKRAGPSKSKTSKILTCQPVKNKRKSKIKDDIEDDILCLSCFKPFSNSLPAAVWIQCSSCQWWAHASCLNKEMDCIINVCTVRTL